MRNIKSMSHFRILVVLLICTSTLNASYVYVNTLTGVTKLDFDSGNATEIADYSGYSTTATPRGIALNQDGDIFVGTKQYGTLKNRVIKIDAQSGNVSQFTSPISATYGLGQIGFNDSDELFVAGGSTKFVHKYDSSGNFLKTMVWDAGASGGIVGLMVENDYVYSAKYFSPRTIMQYDNSSGIQKVFTPGFPDTFYPACLLPSHNGNIAIGGGRGGPELYEYNILNGQLNVLFDLTSLGLATTYSQYDPFNNTYLVSCLNTVSVFDVSGSLLNTYSGSELIGCGALSKVYENPIPAPGAFLLGVIGIFFSRWHSRNRGTV